MSNVKQRIERVCEYIEYNLDTALTLDSLSEVASYSKYHFHRVFKSYTGVSVQQYVLLLRLRRASFRIAFQEELNLSDIGYEAGFSSPEAFTRAFQREVGQLPSVFRKQPDWSEWHRRLNKSRASMSMSHDVTAEIVDFPETRIAYLTHIGSPGTVLNTAGKFIEWRKESGLSPVKSSRTFGIPYSDPDTTLPEEFRWDVCGSVDCEIPSNLYGVTNGVIPAGKCAVLRHKGSHSKLNDSIWYFFNTWLLNSGEETRDQPIYFEYLNFIFEVDESDLLTDIYLPLK